MKVVEAARKLGVSTPTVHRMIHDKELKARKVGRAWEVDARSLPTNGSSHGGEETADELIEQLLAELAVTVKALAKAFRSYEREFAARITNAIMDAATKGGRP